MATRQRKPKTIRKGPSHRDRVLEHFAALRVGIGPEHLDEVLAHADRQGMTHLAFLETLLESPAQLRADRLIERRIKEARLPERKTLADFDWAFNAKTIDRARIEELATCEFIRRQDNVVMVGLSGVGKSHIALAVALEACGLGYRVRYTTSADLIADLTASLADQTLPKRLRHYTRPHLLIIDEFGFDRVEREANDDAASLLFKVVHARSRRQSTLLATNVDFKKWPAYLGDPPLAMGLMDRLVDGAIIFKMKGRSYRAFRSEARNAE